MPSHSAPSDWKMNWVGQRMPWNRGPLRPAEVADGLCRAMLARQNSLEDANYQKVAPNRFVVELSEQNYHRQYHPLAESLVRQWRERLLECLVTANTRLGRQEYRLEGPVMIELRPAPDLKDNQARLLSQVQPSTSQAQPAPPVARLAPVDPKPAPPRKPQPVPVVSEQPEPQAAYNAAVGAHLQWLEGEHAWTLVPGDNTLGRAPANSIHLDLPEVQEKRLVSAQHAYVRCHNGRCLIFDGSLAGRPSANGTYVNFRRVSPEGQELKPGDIIVLAALDPQQPLVNAPGVAALRFEHGPAPRRPR